MLRQTNDIPVITSPYPHVALSNSLANYDDLVADFPAENRFARQIRMHGDLTYGDEEYAKLIGESAAYRAVHDWVYSAEFIELFLQTFDDEIDVRVKSGELMHDPRLMEIRPNHNEGRTMIGPDNDKEKETFLFSRIDIGIGKEGYGKVNGGRGIHVDNLTRLVSILFYIDDNETMVGGEHRLYGLNGSEPFIDKVYPPQGNLMVASLQTNWALHDVNPVTKIEGSRKAFYAAVACSRQIWKPHRDQSLQRLTVNRYKPTIAERALRKIKNTLRA